MYAVRRVNMAVPERGEKDMNKVQTRWREELSDLAGGLALLWTLARERSRESDADYSFFDRTVEP